MELIALGDRDHADMVRAVTYGRQSHRSETDSQASPLMQREKGIAYITSQDNWRHTGHYEDVGLSGYDPNVFRPDFERMMEDARQRKFDVVVIYMLSRLTRQGAAEALKIQEELASYGVAIVSTQEPFINTSDDNPFGVAFFALIAGLAHQESKNKSKFIRDAFAELKAKGSHSSGPVPYGFEAEPVQVDGVTIRKLKPGTTSDVEIGPESTPADNVMHMITAAESGEKENAIAYSLSEKRARTPLGSLDEESAKARREAAQKRRKDGATDEADYEWSSTVVRRILRDPRLAGFAIGPVDPKTKRREILRDEEGQPVRPHEGFIEPKRWYDLQALLDGRKRERNMDRAGTMTFLGSWGVLRCGKCRSGMTVSNVGQTYVCNLRRSVGDVEKHVTRVTMNEANSVVAARLWAKVATLDPESDEDLAVLTAAAERFAVQGADPEAAAELAEQEAQLDHVQRSMTELYQDRTDGLYEGPTGRQAFKDTILKYQRHEARCTARIDELRAAATVATRLPLDEWAADTENGDPMEPGGLWDRWDVADKRAFLALFVDEVVVNPNTTRRGTAWERVNGRIEIEWATPKSGENDNDSVTA
ncbi:recombinase family protein [Streptomyces scabiei]|uniref:recombinase family protein n=2 Tax=Streptomyces scabiei TaxID=1930 RepID=UPI0029A02323|nr:recombinase family protein [Streptomyces scabiei]MDX2885649.1 recombinase family protein [Streptomyces scabiei]MDX3051626.1 recombinase family protein [Streptomyces scabiei]